MRTCLIYHLHTVLEVGSARLRILALDNLLVVLVLHHVEVVLSVTEVLSL